MWFDSGFFNGFKITHDRWLKIYDFLSCYMSIFGIYDKLFFVSDKWHMIYAEWYLK